MNPVTLELCKRIQAHMNQKYNISTLTVPHAWMEGCVTWYYAENNRRPSLDPNAVLQVLQFVTKQWLMVDFVELKLKSLPPDLGNLKVTNLSGNFLVQLIYLINIGQSAYSQHLKITQGSESNAEVSADVKIPSKWEPKGKRMLQAHLTDGTQMIKAVEFQPIPQLHLDLIPGTKMLIKGPVQCRRGVILLRPENVEILGGEVKSLVQKNAPENVLARLVGKTENPNPVYGSYSLQTAAAPSESQQLEDGDEFVAKKYKRPASEMKAPPAKKCQPDPCGSSADDMFPDDDDEILLLASAEQVEMAPPPPPPDVKPEVKPHPPQQQQQSTTALFRQPIQPIERPFTYLALHFRQQRLKSARKPEPVCIKGFVSTIKSRLEVQQGRWKLCATINDGSSALDVEFSSEILEGLIGYSPQQLKAMMTTKEEEKLRLANQALENTKQSLIRMNCLIYIRWPESDAEQMPVVYRLEEIQRSHLEQLQIPHQ